MTFLYAVAFLLSTLLFASFSDLIKMRIDRNFLYVWLGFTIIFFIKDFLEGLNPVKWGIIILFSILSWRGVGKIFKLARADVAAIAAVSSILTFPQVILFYLILFVINKLIVYPLRFLRKMTYPFIPVIFISSLVLFIIIGVVDVEKVVELLRSYIKL